MKRLLSIAAIAAVAIHPVAAGAQQARNMPDPTQVQAATRYAMPQLFKGFTATCKSTLAADGYVFTNQDRLTNKFAAAAQGSWPQAKDALLQIAAKEGGSSGSDLLTMMPDESLRPFVDGILFSLVATEIKPTQCADVERGLELLDPMPVENIAGLVGFALELMERDRMTVKSQSRVDVPAPPRPRND